MRRLITLSIALSFSACAQKESTSKGGAGSATPPAPAAPAAKETPPEPAPAPAAGSSAETIDDGVDEVAKMVVHDVGSKALGSQTIEPSCVAVAAAPAGKWTVAFARLNNCGDKTARSIVWLYKRADGGKWNEDYVGQPPKCWKGVPPDLAEAVSKLSKIPAC